MPRIVGLDLSLTSTGLCRIDVHAHPSIGNMPIIDSIVTATVTSKPTADKSYRAMSQRIEKITEAIGYALESVDLAVIEGPAFGAKGAHTHSRDWLWGRVYDTARDMGITTVIVTPNQRCKYATGKGNAPKDAVLAAAIKRWPTVDVGGNDQADALVLAAIGARSLGLPVDGVPAGFYEPVMAKLSA